RAGLLVLAAAKRGAVGSPARAYAAAYVEGPSPLADALTVNPSLGRESIEPFLAAARRDGAGVFVLVKTSNAGADIQDVTLRDGRPLWQHVALAVAEWGSDLIGEGGLSSVGAVVGAPHPREGGEARPPMPQAVCARAGGRRCPGRVGRRCRPRVPERPRERARERFALHRLRLPGDRRRLPRGGGSGGGQAQAGDLGRFRLVVAPATAWRRYVGPAAFL